MKWLNILHFLSLYRAFAFHNVPFQSRLHNMKQKRRFLHISLVEQSDERSEDGFFDSDPLDIQNFNMDLENVALGSHYNQEDAMPAQKAQDMLEIMEGLYYAEQHKIAREGNDKGCSSLYVKPNAASYTAVINGWSQASLCDDENLYAERCLSPLRAEQLLKRLENKYDKTGDESMKPNILTYVLCIQAWAEAPDDLNFVYEKTVETLFHSHGLADELEEMRSNQLTGAERAESLLFRMKKYGAVPDVRTYTSGIICFVNHLNLNSRRL